MTAAFAATVVAQLELVSPMLLYLDFDLVLGKLELWRLLTNLCFFGTFSMPFVFSMFFLVRYGKELEVKRFEGRSADFLWCLAIAALLMTAIAFVLGNQPFLASSMLSAELVRMRTFTPASSAFIRASFTPGVLMKYACSISTDSVAPSMALIILSMMWESPSGPGL